MRFVRALLAVIALVAASGAILVLISGSAAVELGTLWHGAAPESLNLTQAVTQRYIHPAAWTNVILPILLMPAVGVFIVIAVIALLLLAATLLGRRGEEQGK